MIRVRSILVLVVGLLLVLPASGFAHVQPVAVVVADGGWELSVSTPAERRFLSAAPGTARIDAADAHLIHLNPRGAASMRVRVLSRDGHVTTIEIARGGGAGGADPPHANARLIRSRDSVFIVAGRWLLLIALVTIAGGAVVWRHVVVAGVRSPIRPLGRRSGPGGTQLRCRPGRLGRLLAIAGLVGVALTVVGLLSQLDAADAWGLLVGTRAGHVLVTLILILGGVVAFARPEVEPTAPAVTSAGVLSFVGLTVISFGGHATSGTDAVLGGVFDAMHMAATAVWLGGLVALLAARRTMESSSDGVDIRSLAAIVVRFSAVAITCVAVLTVTGTYRALAEISTLSDLVDTGYGRALSVKLGLFAVMLGVGGFNRLVIHPRLERAALALADDDRGASRALRVSVRAEIALAAILFGVVAVMIGQPPPT